MIQPNPKVFCNSPWFELNILWNGDLAFCCQQIETIYDKQTPNPYNIRSMTLKEWYNSEPMQQARLKMFEQERWSKCTQCWQEEAVGDSSRRHRQNQKSILFRQEFQNSFEQSPNYKLFENSLEQGGQTYDPPVDLHIDLGNHCNLACKMCWPGASTTIASKMKKLKIMDVDQYLRSDWTKDQEVWQRFLNELAEIPNLKHIHIMGGEPTTHPKFEKLIDFLIEHQKVNEFGFSFVTNGTKYKQSLVDKLKKFKNAGIEISIESALSSNHYVRQGSDTNETIKNIKQYITNKSTNFFVVLRPTISALSVRDFHTLIRFAIDNGVVIKSRMVDHPRHLQPNVIPKAIRSTWQQPYLDLIDEYQLDLDSSVVDINESHYDNVKPIAANTVKQALSFLRLPDELDQKEQLGKMIDLMRTWDREYKLDARQEYPELRELLDQYAY